MPISINNPLAQTVIKGLLRLGQSFNKVWRTLPQYGLPKFHRETFLSEARRITGLWKNEFRVRVAGSDKPLPQSAMQESDLLEAKSYRVYGTLKGYDVETGEEWESTFSFYDDLNRGKDGWGDMYADWVGTYWKEQGKQVTEVRIRNVEHNFLFPY